MLQAVPGLEVARAECDADLEAMIVVRSAAAPELRPPRIENLRHNLASSDVLVYLVARLHGDPAGCAFVDPSSPGHAGAHCVVVPGLRRNGIGSVLLGELGRLATVAGRSELQGEVSKGDVESRRFFERRGYAVVGGEEAVSLDLSAYRPTPVEPLDGIEIVRLSDRPDLLDALYPIGVEGAEDIPGSDGTPSFDEWRAFFDRPSLRTDLLFVALADGEPVGYCTLTDYGSEAHHRLTAVRRVWRRRGIATALKRTQIAAAKEAGFERLVTQSEERNVRMRTLNERLGYRPDSKRSTVVMRGPASVR
jgi:GNAT superfamily N-acetyltransferase